MPPEKEKHTHKYAVELGFACVRVFCSRTLLQVIQVIHISYNPASERTQGKAFRRALECSQGTVQCDNGAERTQGCYRNKSLFIWNFCQSYRRNQNS